MNEPSGTPQDSVRTRWPEAAVAVLLFASAVAAL